jgi:myo-inositol-1(or 4)-monophosphatase
MPPRSRAQALSPKVSNAVPMPKLKKVMFAAAVEASQILLKHFGKIDKVIKKGETDLVTIADKQSEAVIIRCIRDAFPDHGILGEESGQVEGGEDSDFCWVVDPLDGTTNFAHSVPIFSISIAVTYKGKIQMGLVADVPRGEWYFAQLGGGAFVYKRQDNKFAPAKRIQVSQAKTLGDSLIITGFPHSRREHADKLLRGLRAMFMTSRGILRLGSAAIDLCWVACGRGDAFYEPHLQPWDIAAGALIVREAGGKATEFDGKTIENPGHNVMATNGFIHKELLREVCGAWDEGK